MIIRKNTIDFPTGRVVVTAGTRDDYRTLARFHYVAGAPATVAAVWAARFEPYGAGAAARVVGVAVLSYPSALNATRHRVFGIRSMRFGERLRWVNANLRTLSRVIVHPQFRSIGLSRVLIETAIEHCTTPFVEASARMGRVHPLFERAGMVRVEPLEADGPVYYWCRAGMSPSPCGRG